MGADFLSMKMPPGVIRGISDRVAPLDVGEECQKIMAVPLVVLLV